MFVICISHVAHAFVFICALSMTRNGRLTEGVRVQAAVSFFRDAACAFIQQKFQVVLHEFTVSLHSTTPGRLAGDLPRVSSQSATSVHITVEEFV